MALKKIATIFLSATLALTLSSCTPAEEEDIQNSVVIEGENNSEGETGETGETNGGETPTVEPKDPATAITSVEGLNFSDPTPGSDGKAELDRLASQSISALLAFGIYESFEEPNSNTRITYAFDPNETGNQLGIKTEYLDGSKETSYTTGNRTSWLTPHLAAIISADVNSTVTVKADHIEADIAGKGIYKYYFENGVMVRLEGSITGQPKPFVGTIEYVTDRRVKDLVAAVN